MSPALLAALAVAVGGTSVDPSRDPRPSIAVILADDMGYSDIGAYGSEIATPNLDRLAAEGVRFTRFYNCARCCPTRASLLTGLYPHQAGVGHMIEDRGDPAYRGFLNDRCVTIAEALRPSGYRTLMAGKWHVGESRPHWPTDRGFDRYFGLISGASSYFRLDPGRRMARDDRPWTPPAGGFYMTDAFTDAAVEFIDEAGRRPEPFFLYVAYTSPHWPLHALPEDIAKYRGKYRAGPDALRSRRHRRMVDLGIVDPRWPVSPRDPKAPAWDALPEKERDELDLRMAVYAAQIERMDRGIGRILAKLEEVGRRENTLVLFLADNGGCAEVVDRGKKGVPAGESDSFLSYGLPWANASNTPLRLYKHWVHEGGIATPLIAAWPRGIAAKGTISGEPGHVVDIMATCLDAAGQPYPATHRGRPVTPLEGRSLLPVLRAGSRAGPEALFWEHEGNRAVLAGSWKLVAEYRKPWELYRLDEDRAETRDLALDHPLMVADLAARWDAWAARAGVRPWSPKGWGEAKPAPPPSILVAVADDWSWPHAGAYGDPAIRTPTFDRLARDGVLFTRAFCASPSCTPSRGAILSGQAIHRLEEGGNLWSVLPARIPVYPELLEARGYRVGFQGKGWGPGTETGGGRTRNPAGPRFRSFEEFLAGVPAGQPFCFWFGSTDPHRPYDAGSGRRAGLRLEDVRVPPYLPDTPEVRSDILDYRAAVERFDRDVGRLLETLEAFGRAESTLVVMTSDNGWPFPRAKANLYDAGTRMPLAIRWPGKGKRGGAVDDLVSLADLAPTFLEAAGIAPPPEMTGRSLAGLIAGRPGPPRDAVFLERERHANVRAGDLGYPARAVRTADLLYVRNFRPDRWPAGDPEMWKVVGPFGDVDDGPAKRLMLERRDEVAVAPLFRLAFGKRPAEELYDVARDPWQLENLAGRPEAEGRLAEMRARLERWMRETADPRVREGEDRWDRYPYLGPESKAAKPAKASRRF